MKFKVRSIQDFKVYTSEDGRVRLHQCQWRDRVEAGWGLKAHGRTRRGYNVFVDGKLVQSQVCTLRDAQLYAAEALQEKDGVQ